jgi:hypothetical protein
MFLAAGSHHVSFAATCMEASLARWLVPTVLTLSLGARAADAAGCLTDCGNSTTGGDPEHLR